MLERIFTTKYQHVSNLYVGCTWTDCPDLIFDICLRKTNKVLFNNIKSLLLKVNQKRVVFKIVLNTKSMFDCWTIVGLSLGHHWIMKMKYQHW